jgi:hypothetical protein
MVSELGHSLRRDATLCTASMPAAPITAATDLQPYAGTWTASQDGTRIVELVLRVEKGNLGGLLGLLTVSGAKTQDAT